MKDAGTEQAEVQPRRGGEAVPVHVSGTNGDGRPALARVVTRLLGRESGAPEAPHREEDITPHPEVGPAERVVETRPIRPPYSFVRIVFDEERSAHRYEVLEPPLTDEERDAYAFVRDAFMRSLDVDLGTLDRQGARAYLSREYEALAKRHGLRLSSLSRARVGYYLERDFLGFGVIDAIMNDPSIEDVSCDGPKLPIFIYHRKFESIRTNVTFPGDDALDGFVMQLVQRSGKHISVAEPLVDATLPDGSRLQASLSREVTTRGSTFTIRKFRKDPLTPTDLLAFETLSPEMMAYWWLAVEHGASAIICGGTASGKTTSLNALSLFIPPQKKIVSIEDTRELNIPHENWIPGVTRAGGVGDERSDGKRPGEVDMFDLLKAALRQRPEYLLLGEVRGAEAYVLFQAMATGHTVYSTMHADSVQSAVHRLESKPIDIPRNMLSSLDIVCVQGEVRIQGRRVRKMREIVELTGIDPRTGELITNRVFSWDPQEGRFRYSGVSFVLGRVAEESNLPESDLRREFDRRVRVLLAMQKRGLRDIASVSRVIVDYSIDPDRTLRGLEGEARNG
ncbi:MAG TPA: type II/IV secretion system ATPase subunit [Candidatus Thermoplasmatota archaeon]|nr:type II/IV secretion system ATPase subunit [Candidatus Thermoplasmatota archaeon]